jgi:tetratricopeptide (TPR) repeat protein
MMNLNEIFDEAYSMVGQGYLFTAKTIFEDALGQNPNAIEKARTYYELGALHWRYTGNGEEARRCFQTAVEECERLGSVAELKVVQLNAYENLMLLSLSYDEYDTWVAKAEGLSTDKMKLKQHKDEIHRMRDRPLPWLEVLHAQTDAFFQQELYASAGAVYGLILKNRARLRLSRDHWKGVALSYAEMILEIFRQCVFAMRKKGVKIDPDEWRFMAKDAIPLVSEYADQNRADAKAQELLEDLKDLLKDLPPNIIDESPKATPGWLYISSAIAGAVLGYFLLQEASFPLGAIIGGLFGLVIAAVMAPRITPGKQEVSKPSPIKHVPLQEGEVSSPALEWQTSGGLKKAVVDVGLEGIGFQLIKVDVAAASEDDLYEGDVLRISFSALNSVPQGKEHAAGLALRCIVGLTLPLVAATIKGLKVDVPDMPYTVNLGSGVPLSLVIFTSKVGQAVSLKAASREENANWYVELKPATLPIGDMRQAERLQKQIFEQLKPAFESLKPQHIILGSR